VGSLAVDQKQQAVIDNRLLDSKAEPMTYRETGIMDGAAAVFPDVFGD